VAGAWDWQNGMAGVCCFTAMLWSGENELVTRLERIWGEWHRRLPFAETGGEMGENGGLDVLQVAEGEPGWRGGSRRRHENQGRV
jgi:hypothetical protein